MLFESEFRESEILPNQPYLSPSPLQAVGAAVAHLAQVQERQQREQQQLLREAGVECGAEAEAGSRKATRAAAAPSSNNAACEDEGQEWVSRCTGSDPPSSSSSDSSAVLGGGGSGAVAALIRRRPDLVASVLAQTPQQCVEEWQSMAKKYK